MKRQAAFVAGAVAAGLLAMSVAASPYWALHRLRSAVEERDAQAFSERVDYPLLRASMKEQLKGAMRAELGGEGADGNPLAAFGQAMAGVLIDPLVDMVVTPGGVMVMMERGKTSLPRPGQEPERPAPADRPGRDAEKVDYALSYRGWDRVALTRKGGDGGSFILRRYGVWHWKLAGIELPPGT
ncbi:DUF2939 domain-containing protein [Massilia niastensis]|uniref:DUF2939 domain-containing protein n=1 Tax=Massilia niastensis TaxID=544911 RepID=UPI000380098A|nr:DUF2939 domain-containing protein [Massilia niastensis]